MPTAAPRPCATPGCPHLVTTATPCPLHRRKPWTGAGRGTTGAWRAIRARVLAQADGLCEVCRTRAAVEVHHVVSMRRGGTDEDENLRAICHECHLAATARQRRRQ